MVLEQLFYGEKLQKSIFRSFVLGSIASVVGIVIARILFGANSGLASVMFASILLLPILRNLFYTEEKKEEQKRFSIKRIYKENAALFHVFIGIFLGGFFTYFLAAAISIKIGIPVEKLFGEQLFLDMALLGRASFTGGMFFSILQNNWIVLLACFLLSFFSGSGATFFIMWNASAWGVIFGVRSVLAAATLGEPFIQVAALMLLIILPHLLLEATAYILAGISGAIISDDVVSNSKSQALRFIIFALILFIFLFFLRKIPMNNIFSLLLQMLIILGGVYLFKYFFKDEKHQKVFRENYLLLLVALFVFVIGVLIETIVLNNSGLLQTYYAAAYSWIV